MLWRHSKLPSLAASLRSTPASSPTYTASAVATGALPTPAVA